MDEVVTKWRDKMNKEDYTKVSGIYFVRRLAHYCVCCATGLRFALCW